VELVELGLSSNQTASPKAARLNTLEDHDASGSGTRRPKFAALAPLGEDKKDAEDLSATSGAATAVHRKTQDREEPPPDAVQVLASPTVDVPPCKASATSKVPPPAPAMPELEPTKAMLPQQSAGSPLVAIRTKVKPAIPPAKAAAAEQPLPVAAIAGVAETWQVIWKHGVNVRIAKDKASNALCSKPRGSVVIGVFDGLWLMLEGEPGFMMVKSGKNQLLEKVVKEATDPISRTPEVTEAKTPPEPEGCQKGHQQNRRLHRHQRRPRHGCHRRRSPE